MSIKSTNEKKHGAQKRCRQRRLDLDGDALAASRDREVGDRPLTRDQRAGRHANDQRTHDEALRPHRVTCS